jgi:nicotinate phosphoribosyltransferase
MNSPRTCPSEDPLLLDLYQLTMLQAYWQGGMNEIAVFEFFVRRLPRQRGFLLAAGLEQVLQYLENLRFRPDDIAWLRSLGRFDPGFLNWLAGFRFEGDVHAMPEGTIFFPNEPILRVTAPMPQAQLVESRIVNLLQFQTLIATKAARMVLQQPGAILIDFGLRRAHGAEAGLLAARAAYIAGFSGSATLAAERAFGVPAFGTMAHSFVQAHATEETAFRRFAAAWPGNVTLLIDTYDTIAAAHRVVALAHELAAAGITVGGVRLDSGDLIALSKEVRAIFDAAGLNNLRIFASSSVDEYFLAEAAAAGAPIDGYGIGTLLTTSADLPYLDCAYKLQEYAGTPRRKRSAGKATWPGRKQVFRRFDDCGMITADTVTLEGDPQPGLALIEPVMRSGGRLGPGEAVGSIRQRATAALASLPQLLRKLEREPEDAPFEPEIAPALHDLAQRADEMVDAAEKGA